MIFTNKQKLIYDEFIKFWKSNSRQVFEFGGFAGTGKSTIAKYLFDSVGLKLENICSCAYTGQAAIVMRSKGIANATTIHSAMLEPVEFIIYDDKGKPILHPTYNTPITKIEYIPRNLSDDIKLIFIDEGRMVPMWMKDIIETRGVKVLITGDTNQLPSVDGESAYLDKSDIIILDEIVRQDEGSRILYLAERARLGKPIHAGYYGGNVLVVDKSEITEKMILNSDIALCYSNKTREKLNNNIRKNILKIYSNLPQIGERMICRKNNWNIEVDGINLVNGLNGIIVNSPDISGFDSKTFNINFKPFLMDKIFYNLLVDYEYLIADVNKRKYIKNSKYFTGEKFEFSYASTVHLSQGSEYNMGIYLDEWVPDDIRDQLRYTAITRFKYGIIYGIQVKKFY